MIEVREQNNSPLFLWLKNTGKAFGLLLKAVVLNKYGVSP